MRKEIQQHLEDDLMFIKEINGIEYRIYNETGTTDTKDVDSCEVTIYADNIVYTVDRVDEREIEDVMNEIMEVIE